MSSNRLDEADYKFLYDFKGSGHNHLDFGEMHSDSPDNQKSQYGNNSVDAIGKKDFNLAIISSL
jgi:hypothetical protein